MNVPTTEQLWYDTNRQSNSSCRQNYHFNRLGLQWKLILSIVFARYIKPFRALVVVALLAEQSVCTPEDPSFNSELEWSGMSYSKNMPLIGYFIRPICLNFMVQTYFLFYCDQSLACLAHGQFIHHASEKFYFQKVESFC